MKKSLILLLISILLITSLGFAYASKPTEVTKDEPLENIGESLNNAKANTTIVTKKALKEPNNYTLDKFKDLHPEDWFIKSVSRLVELGGIDGYPDDTFRPNNTITTAEFIKMTVGSLGYSETEPKVGHWATNYVKKAEEIGLIDKGEYSESELNKPINRYQMIKIVIKATEHKGEKAPSNYKEYENYIKDIKSVPLEYKGYVIKGYAIGIVDGYEDTSFKGDRNLTRAEAVTVIMRIYNEGRVDVKEKINNKKDDDWIEPEFDVWYSTKNKDEYNYFIFFVDNYENYEGKGYTFKTECISHPQLNKVKIYDPIDQKYFVSNKVEVYTKKDDDVIKAMGKIYELDDLRRTIDIKTGKPFIFKEGEKLTYKVTVTNGKTTKIYELSAEFRNKKFRY